MRPALRALWSFMTKKVLVPGPDHPITIDATGARVTVTLGGRVVADSRDALTLREAAYPPVQYIPIADVDPAVLQPSDHTSYCPFKGDATYYDLQVGEDVAPAALWTYVAPHDAVAEVKDHVAFYPDRVDAIEVHDAG
jgi:uncharacterized protein (DUF427 family)